MRNETDREYICGVIKTTCRRHKALDLLDYFSFSIDQINSVEKRCTLRFYNELPSYYDIRWDSSFQEEYAFYEWLITQVGEYIRDAKRKTASFKESERMAREILANLSGLPADSDMQKHAQAIIFGKLPITNDITEKGKSTMATETNIKIETERHMTESEARYDVEVKRIDAELAQAITDAQYQAQSKRCEVEKLFREERIKEQEAEKAMKRKAYYDGLIAAGFEKEQAMQILLKEL